MTTKQSLISNIDIFDELYFEFLKKYKYTQSSMLIERLENEKKEFPLCPVIQSIWKNMMISQSFVIRLYENYFIDFEIQNHLLNKTISINGFKKNKNTSDIEMYLLQGDLKEKYIDYLLKTKELISSTELISVLTGEDWIDVPFDWQGQK